MGALQDRYCLRPAPGLRNHSLQHLGRPSSASYSELLAVGEPGGTASQKHCVSLCKGKGTCYLWTRLGGHTTTGSAGARHDAADQAPALPPVGTFIQPRTAKVLTSVREMLPRHLGLSSPELELASRPSRDRAAAGPDTQTYPAAASRSRLGPGLSHTVPVVMEESCWQLGKAEWDKEQLWSCSQVLVPGGLAGAWATEHRDIRV